MKPNYLILPLLFICVNFYAQTLPKLDSGLVLLMTVNNNHIYDSSLIKNTAVINGTGYTTDELGINGSAAHLPTGVVSYIAFNDKPEYNFHQTGELSIITKILPYSITNSQECIITKWGPASNNDDEWAFCIENSGKINLIISTINGEIKTFKSKVSIQQNQWSVVAGVWNSKTNYIYLYINGVVSDSIFINLKNMRNTTEPILIGNSGHKLIQSQFDGKVDEVRIYNRALTHLEIRELYVPIKEEFLVSACLSDTIKFKNFKSNYTIRWYKDKFKKNIYNDTIYIKKPNVYIDTLYWVNVRNGVESFYSTPFILYYKKLKIEQDTVYLCNGPVNIDLDPHCGCGVSQNSYNWSDGYIGKSRKLTQTGNYIVTVSYYYCSNSDTIVVLANDQKPLIVNKTLFSGCYGDLDTIKVLNNKDYKKFNWSIPRVKMDTTEYYKEFPINQTGPIQLDVISHKGCIYSFRSTMTLLSTQLDIIGSDSIFAGQKNSPYNIVTNGTGTVHWQVTGGDITQYLNNNQMVFINWHDTLLNKATIEVSIDRNEYTCSSITKKTIYSKGYLPLSINITTQHINCSGKNTGTISVEVTGGKASYEYKWKESSKNNSMLDSLSGGLYHLTVVDANKDTISKEIEIKDTLLPITFQYQQNDILCSGEKNGLINIFPSGGSSPYQIFINDSNYNQTQITNLSSGVYFISITDSYGCSSDVATIEIKESLPIRVDTIIKKPFCYEKNDGVIEIIPSGGSGNNYTYNWSNGSSNQKIENLYYGIYFYTVTDAVGCSYFSQIDLKPLNDFCFVFPTAFSPNKDGINDDWYIINPDNFALELSIEIFDRWGRLIYLNSGKEIKWNGNDRKGYPVPLDSYHYVIEAENPRRHQTGQITVIR